MAIKYRAARDAKVKLSEPGPWEKILQELFDDDIRTYQQRKAKKKKGRPGTLEDGVLEKGVEEGRDKTEDFSLEEEEVDKRAGSGVTHLELSWIWTVDTSASKLASSESVGEENQHSTQDVESNGERERGKGKGKKRKSMGSKDEEEEELMAADSILQVEWSKSRARAKRATEEVLLLCEEMRRVLAFLKWKAQQWLDFANQCSLEDDSRLKEGMVAYAKRQSILQLELHKKFKGMWDAPLQDASPKPPVSPNTANIESGLVDRDDEETDSNGSDDEDEDLDAGMLDIGDGDDLEDNE
ncbi:hypothetical protein BJ165DRAFT_1533004 [Panaeolus papilionaceus]|nr:hypothetical protein BJ165DRAFT_1533004 [Panaeolus papilionaceus]